MKKVYRFDVYVLHPNQPRIASYTAEILKLVEELLEIKLEYKWIDKLLTIKSIGCDNDIVRMIQPRQFSINYFIVTHGSFYHFQISL